MPIIPYQTKIAVLTGTSFEEVAKKARRVFTEISKKTKRQAYVRSAYFKREKVFLNYYWPHLNQKEKRDRIRRLKLLPCALELIERSRNHPTMRVNPNNKHEILYRFAGLTSGKELFRVQIKENTKTGNRYLMSTFYEQ